MSLGASFNVALLRRECLRTLNVLRRRHGVEPVVYDSEGEAEAQQWSAVLAKLNKRAPSRGAGLLYGEAVAVKRRAVTNLTGWEIITTWYAEGSKYKYGIEEVSEENRNFTQIMWAATRELALGITFSKDGEAYAVAHFRPLGNIDNQFNFNVFPPCEIYRNIKPNLEEMNIIGLNIHNKCRELHGVTPLILCHDLIASAQKWAESIAPLKGKLTTSNKCSVGESIAHEFNPLGFICSHRVVEGWYMLGRLFDFKNPEVHHSTNYYTQIIWKGTTDIGFGRASCGGHNYMVVHYRPPGNLSNVSENVFKTLNCHTQSSEC